MGMRMLEALVLVPLLIEPLRAQGILERRDIVITASTPVNWTYTGCYVDQQNSSTLSGAMYSNNTAMTKESCIMFCNTTGFIHAGVESSSQCFCGNDDLSQATNASASDCSYSCTGNATEACGGSDRLNVFTSNQTVTNSTTNPGFGLWALYGCYGEGTNGRALTTSIGDTPGGVNNMTVANCVNSCATAGFVLAGVEYAGKCFCGNQFSGQSQPAVDGYKGCNIPCNGNATEFCGGVNHLDVYGFNNTVSNPLVTTSSSSTSSSSVLTSSNSVAATTQSSTSGSSSGSSVTITNSGTSTSSAESKISSSSVSQTSLTTTSSQSLLSSSSSSSPSSLQLSSSSSTSTSTSSQSRSVVTPMQTVTSNPQLSSSSSTSTSTSSQSRSVVTPTQTVTSNPQLSSTSSSVTVINTSSQSSTALSVSASPSWYYAGCWTDAVDSRTLNNQMTGNANIMTAKLCMSECSSAGYNISGVEYYSECYCDTQIRYGGTLATDPTTCNTPCQGNSSDICGGGNRLSLYKFGVNSVVVSSSSSLTQVPVSTMSNSVGSGSSTTSVTTSAASVLGWSYLGCYTDSVGARALGNAINGQGNVMTNALCQSSCKSGGYTLSGTEYSGECYCDNALRDGNGPASDGSVGCSMTCNGNSSEICGGANRLSFYSFGSFSGSSSSSSTVQSSTSSQAATRSPSQSSTSQSVAPIPTTVWVSLGCYNDSVGARTLRNPIYGYNDVMTVELCQNSCKSAAFDISGVEYGGECYCDNAFQNYGGPAPDGNTGCNMACHGSSSEICGGGDRLNVYQYRVQAVSSTSTPTSSIGSSSVSVSISSSLTPTTTSSQLSSITTSRVSSPINSSLSGSILHTDGTTSSSSQSSSLSLSSNTSSFSRSVTTSRLATTSLTANKTTSALRSSSTSSQGMDSLSLILTKISSVYSNTSMLSSVPSSSQSQFTASPTTVTSISASPTMAVGWSPLGCYIDSIGARTLGNAMQVPGGAGSMTVEACEAACLSNNYHLAGVEYSGECYCDNAFQNGGGPAPDESTGCNMNCNGNSSETCGGSNRLNVYQYYSGPSSTLSSTSSGVVTSTTASSAATALPSGWKYNGCYIDGANGRILSVQQNDNQQLTIESCIQTCVGLGYTVAGMEYGVQCFCDNFIRNGAALASSDSACSMTCGGNVIEKCGAGSRVSLYNIGNLTVYQPPSQQNSSLPGNWTYQGCLTDNADARSFSYRITNMVNNNTATNCLTLCSTFGYPAGGMEFGSECYCGDFSDIAKAGATMTPQSDCNMACSGDPTSICGGSSRISYYAWIGSPLYTWSHPTGSSAGQYEFLIGGVVIPLITQQTITGKVTFLEKFGTEPANNSTGAYELDLAEIGNFAAAWRPMHIKTDVFCSASLTLPDKAGRQINLGGWANDATYGVRLYWPDGSPGVAGVNDWKENVNEVALQNGRWYPTAMIMANGSILVVGGQEGSNGAPVPTLEIMPASGGVLYCDWLQRTDPYNLYPFLAVLPSGGVFVAYYNEARILSEVTLQTQRVLPNMPAAVNDFLGGRTYPFEGTSVLLPQYAPYTNPLTFMVCGGSTPGPEIALDNCVSIQPEVTGANWTIERMPSARVISCMTALPDGTYLILNGGQQGRAGFGLATNPNHNAVLYDPSKPINQRMSVMANTTIDRLYHSEAILLQDGRVLVSGSDPEDDRFAQEYRVEVFVPPYLLTGTPQPTFKISNKDWAYGQAITLQITSSTSSDIRVSLLGAESSTHGNSMGQRTIFPAVGCAGLTCTVTAPPNSHVCPPGWFQLFVLDGGTPSKSVFVRVGGDPAGLGNWPAYEDFHPLPGV